MGQNFQLRKVLYKAFIRVKIHPGTLGNPEVKSLVYLCDLDPENIYLKM